MNDQTIRPRFHHFNLKTSPAAGADQLVLES